MDNAIVNDELEIVNYFMLGCSWIFYGNSKSLPFILPMDQLYIPVSVVSKI